jgi:hypothetical protein
MPYRTLDDRIDGVVISFWDISVAKELEGKMQDMQRSLENRLAGQSGEARQGPNGIEGRAQARNATATKPVKPDQTHARNHRR